MAATVIVRDPEILGGIPCFRGTRVPFQNLLDYLEAGDTLDQFLEQFPTVTVRAGLKEHHFFRFDEQQAG